MGTSITSWDSVAEYFVFANNPFMLVLFSAGVLAICVGLIMHIKRHEDAAFAECEKSTTQF
ncbi:hypothetical protein OAP63_17280 [Vibrio sp.]|uniref:Uncharacterized protein n=1 Tax=Vibrio viridaestus TaxID=2487322 RepID=A0A3N9TLW9_9VIBR|nr:hypothetical protein [Vibrio viridaestus]MDC0612486.1 hypothetical protein [Vibrio sp.]RQW65004.1 hypothetical protein EES38_02945 [Vibrio viridaestus]